MVVRPDPSEQAVLTQRLHTAIVCSLTGSRIVCAAAIAAAAASNHWRTVFWLALAAFLTDFADGRLARHWQVVSKFGMTFDPLADKLICLMLLVLASVYVSAGYWMLLIIFAAYDTFTMTMRLVRPVPMPASGIAKIKTALLMVGLLAMIAGRQSSALSWAAAGLLVVAATLTIRSFAGYLRAILRHSSH